MNTYLNGGGTVLESTALLEEDYAYSKIMDRVSVLIPELLLGQRGEAGVGMASHSGHR